MTSLMKNKVVLGLSGGVDSTAAALLLREKGYEVTGLYFSVKEDREKEEKAAEIAEQLGIGLIVRDVSELFERTVISAFCDAYMDGRTPNPCVTCNPAVKFKTLIDAADETGAYYIATGHYADTYHDEKDDVWYIKCAANERKDQSYMLYRLGQDVISRLLLPLNEIGDKAMVRDMVRERDMSNADDRDSQEICFIDPREDYQTFLKGMGLRCEPGYFTDSDGNILGEHDGICNYTIGQRKGLGITLGRPAFVTAIDSANNRVVLGSNDDLFGKYVVSDDNILYGRRIVSADDIGSASGEKHIGAGEIAVNVKIRYAARPAAARIRIMEDGKIKTAFDEPQRAATPGQSIVFYKDGLVIGGGFIV